MKQNILIILIANILIMLTSIDSIAQTYWIENKSYITDCAEHDNVNIPLYGPAGSTLLITATHLPYAFTDADCPADFSGSDCHIICPDTIYAFTPESNKIFDDGFHAIWVHSMNEFWRPKRMKVIFNKGASSYGHYLAVSKKIDNRDEWPQFLILYCDSYLRLVPHPPQGLEKTCFGSSVIVGPAEGIQASTCARPYCDIDSILIDTVGTESINIDIWYHDGSTGSINASVNTQVANLMFTSDSSPNRPLVTFRSMWIDSSNCDADNIACESGKYPLLSEWSTLEGSWFKFFRSHPSVHNNSAPDIKIEIISTDIVSPSEFDKLRNYTLYQNYPNPFNPSTMISFYLESKQIVSLKVFDVLGREVAVLTLGNLSAGFHSRQWNVMDMPNGVYFYRLQAGEFTETKKMILLR